MLHYNLKKNIVFLCLKIFFTFHNSVDPDEMQHFTICRGFLNTKGKQTTMRFFN